MSNVPYYLDKGRFGGYRYGNGTLIDGMVHDGIFPRARRQCTAPGLKSLVVRGTWMPLNFMHCTALRRCVSPR